MTLRTLEGRNSEKVCKRQVIHADYKDEFLLMQSKEQNESSHYKYLHRALWRSTLQKQVSQLW